MGPVKDVESSRELEHDEASYLHLFRKLSMLLFFLRAGKSRSYTSASRPSCGERRRVNTRAFEAAPSTGAQAKCEHGIASSLGSVHELHVGY